MIPVDAILQSMQHPAMRHAMLVHWPIVLAVLAAACAVAGAVLAPGARSIRTATVVLLLAVAVSVFAAKQSGERAYEHVRGDLPAEALAALDRHAESASWIVLVAVVPLVISLGMYARRDALAGAARWLMVPAALLSAGWIATIAHHGGTAVYRHAVGVTLPPSAQTDASSTTDPRMSFFLESVRPILVERCMVCHHPRKLAGDMDLTTMRGVLAGGESGMPALIPGDPEQSPMVRHIRGEPGVPLMPPRERLEPREIEAIVRWIAEGAVWMDGAGGPAGDRSP